MNEQVENFISGVFSPEYIFRVEKAFSLFEAFGYRKIHDAVNDVISDEGLTHLEQRADSFTRAVIQGFEDLEAEHLIKLTDQAKTNDHLNICDALFRFQHLENYIVYESILQSDDDSIDKMARILAELMSADEGYVLTLLHDVDERTLTLMQEFIDSKGGKPVPPIDPKVIERLRSAFKILGDKNVGWALLDAGMRPGYPLHLYLPYVEEHIVVENNDAETVTNLMSILYISDISESELLNLYREVGERIFKSVPMVGRLESQALMIISKIQELRVINDEQARVLKERTESGTGE